MTSPDHDYTIDLDADRAVVRGILRLPTPGAYDEAFTGIRERIEDAGDAYTLDLSDVSFMNSSGIRGLATLILRARDRAQALRIVGSGAIPWQKKTMASLDGLYAGLTIDLR